MDNQQSLLLIKNQNFIEEKLSFFEQIITDTIISCQKYKILDILTTNEINICIQNLENISKEIKNIYSTLNNNYDQNSVLNKLQNINYELSSIIKLYGTQNISDLISICFNNDFINILQSNDLINKYRVISQFTHPTSYKIIPWKNTVNSEKLDNKKISIQKNKILDNNILTEYAQNLDCFDLARNSKSFQSKVYGIKIILQNSQLKQTIILNCIVDDILLECLNNEYIINKINILKILDIKDLNCSPETWNKFISSLTIKDLLINNPQDLKEKFIGIISQLNLIKQKTINQVVKEFLNTELYIQRNTIIQLLLKNNDAEYEYLAYLLYDLLSNDSNNIVDTQEQTLLFDSLPWNIKKYFRDAMKSTIEYTNNLSNFDNNKIPLEQQICLLKANDNVKEKAMQKLKEIKSKSEDSGSKARQYLDGLLKIPFNIYKEELILNKINDIQGSFKKLINIPYIIELFNIEKKEKYTNLEIQMYLKNIRTNYEDLINNKLKDLCNDYISTLNSRSELIIFTGFINELIKQYNIKISKISSSGKNISEIKKKINDFIEKNFLNKSLIKEILLKSNSNKFDFNLFNKLDEYINLIDINQNTIYNYMNNINLSLETAVHGHDKAKRQVERIIGQWINGEKTGYCFGFEGPPGVGKTSLAKKGIANCLLDDYGESRPFAFIGVGGSSNGSTLEGHNYTYVGSTWGKIVDILIEKKCMNPIIFIDELDKISRTEHGKEIIGILTHLIDSTQNDTFQDKYFNGIDLDLSKALFIFSYNDVDAIDKILLDRIHRVKFEHLTLDDKLVITNKYILPEIYKKMGLENIININNDVIKFIINGYTYEPGVRKLKEILFEIVSEINLSILKENASYEIPINLDIETVRNKYLKERQEINIVKINKEPKIAIINGLWANALGKGGILHIEANYYTTSTFAEFKLTGMQGDVMKESMAVAKTLAWSLLTSTITKNIIKKFEDTKRQGIHIHVPEGATPKDGPSAGTAITVAIYSLLTNKKIKNNIAITGEICLQGNITAIGGLDLKILGGITAGVTTFIYPKQNHKDYTLFIEKYENKTILDNITFVEVEHISEVLKIVFV